MDSPFHEEESATQRTTERFFMNLGAFFNIIEWLKGLISLTEQEQQDAGIYLDRLTIE